MQATPALTKPRKPAVRPRAAVGEALPAYNLADGACTFRHSLTARERTALDRALDIVGRTLTGGRVVCDSAAATKHYLRLQLAGEPAEHFGVLFLDSQHRAIAFERLFTGTLTQTSVYPREVVRAALRHHASGVVLAHNHPSGSVQPSRADEAITFNLKAALSLVDVRVIDHVIVSPSDALSMAERGLV